MLDDLRNQPETAFFQEEESPSEEPDQKPGKVRRKRSFDQVVGMNAFQRFVLSVMLLITVCLLGFMLLFFTDSIYLPFLH